MIGIGFFSVGKAISGPSATFAYSTYQGGFAYGFADGKAYHLGGYGVGSGPYYDLVVPITATNIVGSWSTLTIVLNGVVWTGNATSFVLNLRMMTNGGVIGNIGVNDTILVTTTMTNGSASTTITLTGTNLQNYFNGTTATTLYLEWNPNYYGYYLGFTSATISVT